MVFDPATASHLKPWLVRTLEPICDAEPGALADYILALLKHNVPETDMRKELAVQLDEFLEKECPSFIDTLFTVLRTKSYLPYAASSSSSPHPYSSDIKNLDTGIPIPLDALLSPSVPTSPDRSRKRPIDNDERDGRPPAKGPRLNTDGQFSRYTNGRSTGQDSRSTGGWGTRVDGLHTNNHRDANMGNMGMGGINGSMIPGPANGRSQYQPPDVKRGICRDYHNNGYCARGAFCKYSHGEDAVVPGQFFPPSMPGPGMPFMPMFPNPSGIPFGMGGGTGGAYDPHEARMDMRPSSMGNSGGRPQSRAPILPRVQQEDGSRVLIPARASGELPVIQDLTPKHIDENPRTEVQFESQSQPLFQPPPPPPPQSMDNPPEMSGATMENGRFLGNHHDVMNARSSSWPMSAPMDVDAAPPTMPPNSHGGFRGGNRGRGGKGTFGGQVHDFRPERNTDKTLVVEKIPEDKLTLEHVNGWFKRFGTVTNVAIDAPSAKALVSFSNHKEAHAAWKSEDAVFNNRFVKLFWHRPLEGHGQAGSRMLAASAPLVANFSKETQSVVSQTAVPAPLPSASARKSSSSAAIALAAKQQRLEKQITEQKSLMASLATASLDEKKQIMARLRKLGEEMKPSPTPATPLALPAPAKPSTSSTDHDQKEKERLDKELELHNATAAVEGEEESAEDLKAKLERLKAEAASLGLETTTEPSYSGTSHRPYRGRGRGGRGYYRGAGRGGPPRASMKLDNRPKMLLVKSVSEEGIQALRDWYGTTGQVESLDVSEKNSVVVAFKTRSAAEQGLAKGSNVPTIGPVQVTWFTGVRTPSTKTDPVDNIRTAQNREQTPEPAHPHSSHIHEEEVVASGWGGEDEEDGMGML